ncbi:MAG: enterochelin esterase, partial [Myxococcota bacterium]
MNQALDQLFREGAPNGGRIDTFLRDKEFPLVDETGVTVVYRGHADAVRVRCWISGLEASESMRPLEGTDLWARTIELPKGSRVEYKLEVQRGGHKELILDPLNSVTAEDPFGANSVIQAHGYERPEWSERNPDARSGTIEIHQLHSPIFG